MKTFRWLSWVLVLMFSIGVAKATITDDVIPFGPQGIGDGPDPVVGSKGPHLWVTKPLLEVGTITNEKCDGLPIIVADIEGWPQDVTFDDGETLLDKFARCEVTEIDYVARRDVGNYAFAADELDTLLSYIGPLTACDDDPSCKLKGQRWCRDNKHGGVFISRVTVAGKECSVQCSDSTSVLFKCRKVKRGLDT